jgi:hypothetical protein
VLAAEARAGGAEACSVSIQGLLRARIFGSADSQRYAIIAAIDLCFTGI